MKMLLKAEGYEQYDRLARITHRFLEEFVAQKDEILYGQGAEGSQPSAQSTERLVVRDVKIAIRFAILLRDQEWRGYREAIFRQQKEQWKFEVQLYEKTRAEKDAELGLLEQEKEKVLGDKEVIELDTMREGFRSILKAKYFNEWRAAKQSQMDAATGPAKGQISQKEAEEELESLILGTFDSTKEKITKEEEEELARQEAAAAAAAAALEESKQGASPAKKATPPAPAVETPTRAVRSSPALPEPGPAALRFASQR